MLVFHLIGRIPKPFANSIGEDKYVRVLITNELRVVVRVVDEETLRPRRVVEIIVSADHR